MAAKKATAKKSKVKKAVAKKSKVKSVEKAAPKKAKKSVVKKAAAKPAKKTAAKKAAAKPVKKVDAKKTAAKPVKKTVVKKAAAKPVKKTAVKKTAAKPVKKSAVKKSAAKKPLESIVVPELPVGSARPARIEVSSAAVPPVVIAAPLTKAPAPVAKQGSSGRVILAVIVGIILLIAIVWSNSGSEESDQALPKPTQTSESSPTPSETMSEPTPTPEETQVVETPASDLVYEAPKNAVGNYPDNTKTGLRLTWSAPDASDGLTGYNIEISRSGGPFEMFSNLPASQLSLDLTKSATDGWTTFRISSVYSDGEVASVKPFGFGGQFS